MRRGEPALHRCPVQVVVDLLQRRDCPFRVAFVRPRQRDASINLRLVRAAHAPGHHFRAIVATHANLGDRDVAGGKRLVERIVDIAKHAACFAQIAARCGDRDELPQDLALGLAFADGSGYLLRARDVARAQLNRRDLHERRALLPLRFDSIRRLARAGEIFGRDLREHDVVQHPVAKCGLANLRDGGERLVNRSIGGRFADHRLHARDAGERFGATIRIGNGFGGRERAGERKTAPLDRIFDGLRVRAGKRD